MIIGAGLAGCATAWALAEQGRSSILIERRSEAASEGSGNAGGLFHGVVHRADGRHARWHRAAALAACEAVGVAIARGVRGDVGGLLRVDPRAVDPTALQAVIDALGLPADYVRAVTAGEASRLAGTAIAHPAWFFPRGGWVDPRGFASAMLMRAGDRTEVRLGIAVADLARDGDHWQLRDGAGDIVARAAIVVLANAGGALDLLGRPGWPLMRTRGQMSAIAESAWRPRPPTTPVAGAGYVLPATDGLVWFGAGSQAGDDDAGVRRSDHESNLERLAGLLKTPPEADPGDMVGRTGFRWRSADRLPVIGSVPGSEHDAATPLLRLDQPRFVPRMPGLFVITALGSRGIASSVLGGQLLASIVTGSPAPVEADLVDAVDPARFVSRAVRRNGSDAYANATATAAQPPLGPIDGGSAGA